MANREQIERCAGLLSSRSTDDEKLAGLLLMPRVVGAQDRESLEYIFDSMDAKFIERLMRTGIKQIETRTSTGETAATELPMLDIALSVINVFSSHSTIAAKPKMQDRIPTLFKVATLVEQPDALAEAVQILCRLLATDTAVRTVLEKPDTLLRIVDSACSQVEPLETTRFLDFALNRCSCYIHENGEDSSCVKGWTELLTSTANAFSNSVGMLKFELIPVLANALEPIDRADMDVADIAESCKDIARSIGSSCIWVLRQKSETTQYADQALVLYSHLVRLWPEHVFSGNKIVAASQSQHSQQNKDSELILRLACIEAQAAIDAMMICPPDNGDVDAENSTEAARLRRGWKLPFCAEIIAGWLEWIASWLDEQPESADVDEDAIYGVMSEIHKAAQVAVGFLIDWKDRGYSEQEIIDASPGLVVSIVHMLGQWLATDPKLHQTALPVLAMCTSWIKLDTVHGAAVKEFMRPCVSYALETCGIDEAQFIADLESRELRHDRKPAHEFASPWVGTVDFDDLSYAVYGLQSDEEVLRARQAM
ncbi:hypothetical protein GGH94_003528 [Coemansia aciculifera]|uniref:Neurochondrin family protein n=1 Tax=Coemansia aciculifera TaxID=417176 RepID=A0A9W8M4E1_9FUNG|nr:hypothetical protein GGH94_003528 [Coemansia aciculifera]